MRLEAGCPRCAAAVSPSGSSWSCPVHGAITPLWRATDPEYDAFADYLRLSRPLPTWLPWPLPEDWKVTDFGCVAVDGRPAQGGYVTCTGPSEVDGLVEVTVVTEEPGVGLASRASGVVHTDPGPEAGIGVPPARIKVDGATVPLWTVSTTPLESDTVPPLAGTLDRSVLAGEALGRWLWLVIRPASAALLLHEMGPFQDVSELGPQLVTLPFGRVPRAW
jgi:hypothetical protein